MYQLYVSKHISVSIHIGSEGTSEDTEAVYVYKCMYQLYVSKHMSVSLHIASEGTSEDTKAVYVYKFI